MTKQNRLKGIYCSCNSLSYKTLYRVLHVNPKIDDYRLALPFSTEIFHFSNRNELIMQLMDGQ